MNQQTSTRRYSSLKQCLLTVLILVCPPLVLADYYSEAQDYMTEGKYKHAVIQLKNLLKEQPDHAQGRLLLGQAQIEVGQYSAALKELIKAKSLGTPLADLALPMAHLALLQGNTEEVLKILSEDIQAQVDDPGKAQWLIGYAQLRQGQLEEARTAFKASKQIKPTPEACVGLAKIELNGKQNDKALKHLEQAISIDPQYAEAWFTKGRILGSQGKMLDAIDAFTTLLKSHPKHLAGLLARAEAYFQNKQIELATTDVQQVLSLQKVNPLANAMQARLHILNEDYPNAITSAEKSIKYLPNHLPSLLLLGSSHFAQGNYQQAKHYLEKATSLQPTHWNGNRLLASSHLKLGNPRAALEILEPLDQSQDHQDIALLDIMARAYFKLGAYAKGNEVLLRAQAIDPDLAGINTRLAMGEMILGNNDEALVHLRKANAEENSTEEDAVRLIRFHLIKQRWEPALQQIEASLAKRGTSARMLMLKSTALAGQNKLDAAHETAMAALTADPQYVPAHITLGRFALREGQLQEAKTHYQKALDLQPGLLSAQLALAEISLKSKDPERALLHLKQARNSNPDALQPTNLLVQFYLKQGEKDKAILEAESYQAKNRDQASATQLLIKTYIATGRNKEAISQLDTLIDLEPDNPDHRLHRAQLLVKENKHDMALADVETLLKNNSDESRLLAMKASIQIMSNQLKEAEHTIQNLAQLQPESHLPDQLRGDLKIHQKQPKAAYPYYLKAYEKQPTPYLLNVLINHAQQQKDYPIVIKVLKKYLTIHPEDHNKRILLATTYLNNGENKQAQTEYEKIYKQQPNNPVLLNNLAWLYWQQNDPRGLEFAEKAHQMAPDNTAITDSLGWISLHQGDPKRALSLLQQAASKEAFNPEIRYHYAAALHRNQQIGKAETELKRLLRDFSSFNDRAEAEQLLAKIQATAK